MPDTVHAIVTRPAGISSSGVEYADGDVIFDMPENQFHDWRLIGWVGRATPPQVAEAEAKRNAAEEAAAKAEAAEAAKADKPTKPKAADKPA